jgi:hypothetical protein
MTTKSSLIGKENYYAINLYTNRIEWIGCFKSKGFANRTARAMFEEFITLNQTDLNTLINTGYKSLVGYKDF